MAESSPTSPSRCDDLPIHIPGRIQSFGVLIGCDKQGRIRYLSSNYRLLATGPETTLALGSDLRLFSPELHHLCKTIDQEQGRQVRFKQQFAGSGQTWDLQAHVTKQNQIIFELMPSLAIPHPNPSTHSLMFVALMECRTLESACALATKHIAATSGFGRVMIYKFKNDWTGKVVAETLTEGYESYLGHRFPSSDIPLPARLLYLENPFRILFDCAAQETPILSEEQEPLEMGLCLLRGVSPTHISYLNNMNVRSSASFAITLEGKLWGLVACHDRKPHRPNLENFMSVGAYSVFLNSSLQLLRDRKALSYLIEFNSVFEKPLAVDADESSDENPLVSIGPQVLQMMEATGAHLVTGMRRFGLGSVVQNEFLDPLVEWIRKSNFSKTWSATSLDPHVAFAKEIRDVAAGIFVCPLGEGTQRSDFVVWYRPEVIRQIKWGGLPGTVENMTPRRSFETWKQDLELHSEEWTFEQTYAAEQFQKRFIALRLSQIELVTENSYHRGRTDSVSQILHDMGNIVSGVGGRASELLQTSGSHSERRNLNALKLLFEGSYEDVCRRLEGKTDAVSRVLVSLDVALREKETKRKEHLNKLLEFLSHMMDLLSVHRSALNRSRSVQPKTVLALVVKEALSLMPRRLSKQLGEAQMQIPNSIRLKCDHARLLQVILNLVKNASEALQNTTLPRLIIRSEQQEEGVELCIQDNGEGFDGLQSERLFEKNFSTKNRDSGIGLHGARRLVQSLGGRLTLTSPGPGLGAEAKIFFPNEVLCAAQENQ